MNVRNLKKYPSSTGRKDTFGLRDHRGRVQGVIHRVPASRLWAWIVEINRPGDSQLTVSDNGFASYDHAVASIEQQTQIVVS